MAGGVRSAMAKSGGDFDVGALFKRRELSFDGNRTIGGSNKRGKNLGTSAKRSMVIIMDHERSLSRSGTVADGHSRASYANTRHRTK
jgi:hypothetical protein